jgi:hypothetical protein
MSGVSGMTGPGVFQSCSGLQERYRDGVLYGTEYLRTGRDTSKPEDGGTLSRVFPFPSVRYGKLADAGLSPPAAG